MRVLAAGAAAAAVLGAPASVQASDAGVSTFSGDLFYNADPGEANVVTVSKPGADYVITDPGATIMPGTGCAPVSANQVTCSAPDADQIQVGLGDMNDSATIADNVPELPNDSSDPTVLIEGDDGADTLNGGANVSNGLFGGSSFSSGGDPSANVLRGGSRQDQLIGNDGPDVMTGGAGVFDQFFGGGGNDQMNGGPGFDTFQGSSVADGADVVRGGPDFDSASYPRLAGVRVSLNDVADDGEGCPGPGCEGDDVGVDVENLDTGSGDDVLIGSGAPNSFFTGEGDDTLDGGGGADNVFAAGGQDSALGGTGDDTISGSADEDLVRGGAGDDRFFSEAESDDSDQVFGGSGIDLADYSGANAAVRVSLDNRANDGVAGEDDNIHRDVEDVFGSEGSDVITGSKFANQLEGGDGRDRLRGLGGLDGLDGGRGADLLIGGKGTDALVSGAGPDRLLARGGGADDLSCGSSVDSGTADRRDRIAGDCDRVRRGR